MEEWNIILRFINCSYRQRGPTYKNIGKIKTTDQFECFSFSVTCNLEWIFFDLSRWKFIFLGFSTNIRKNIPIKNLLYDSSSTGPQKHKDKVMQNFENGHQAATHCQTQDTTNVGNEPGGENKLSRNQLLTSILGTILVLLKKLETYYSNQPSYFG